MMQAGQYITDGTAVFIIRDIRDGTPVGDIVGKLHVPHSYVKANGATVQRNSYPTLAKFADDNNLWTDDPRNNPGLFGRGDSKTTMTLPDWRGVFERYVDDGKGYDMGRNVGSYQGDAIRNITATLNYISLSNGSSGGVFTVTGAGNSTLRSGGGGDDWQKYLSFDVSKVVPTAQENRPANIALVAVIKY